MRIRMLETRHDTEDGFAIRLLEAGREYEVRDFLACRLITAGRAVETIPDTQQSPTEE